jgi:colicin import membrane protein
VVAACLVTKEDLVEGFMARKLKVYQTSLGFYDLAIAAPSMKAALEAWGADSNLFHQGVAKESNDPEVVAAAMSKPGVILRRPVGSDAPFRENAELPTYLAGEGSHRPNKARTRKHPPRPIDDNVDRKAALAFEREQRRRESERRREEVAREKARERRQHAIAKVQGALEKAEREHAKRAATIDATRAALEKRSQAENARWKKENEKLQSALRRARD